MKHFTLLLLACSLSWATDYPGLFSKMGDPLYTFAGHSRTLAGDVTLGAAMRQYAEQAEQTRMRGREADVRSDTLRVTYLKELRALKKSHDALMQQLRGALSEAMKSDDAARFLQLVAVQPDALMRNTGFKSALLAFYDRHRKQGRSTYLETLEAADAEQEAFKKVFAAYRPPVVNAPVSVKPVEHYTNPKHPAKAVDDTVRIVTTPSCTYCKKAKRYFKSRRIRYTEIDARSSAGQALMRRHNARGVPLILIGDAVMKGFSAAGFDQIYGK